MSTSEARPFILRRDEGESRIFTPTHKGFLIKVGPQAGASVLEMGSEVLAPGHFVTVHKHLGAEEIVFIHRGRGVYTLGDEEHEVGEGDTIFLPPDTWHGLRNPQSNEGDLEMLWVFSGAGMADYFRDLSEVLAPMVPHMRPGEAPPQTPEMQAMFERIMALGERVGNVLRADPFVG